MAPSSRPLAMAIPPSTAVTQAPDARRSHAHLRSQPVGADLVSDFSDLAAPAVSDWPFVGRHWELAQLSNQLERAIAGQGSVVLLVGEPGIGKTRTAEELTAIATSKGARVAWARSCEGEGPPVYWPWAEVLRVLVSDHPGGLDELPREMARHLAQILPELGTTDAWPHHPAGVDVGASRFPLFQAVLTLLAGAARTKPVVVVLDDLHWADHPSLALLTFVARGLRSAPLLIIGTYRDVEIGRSHPLRDVLGRLARESVRLPLTGLSEGEVAEVIAEARGVQPAPTLATAVHAQTDGNPFLVSEVVRQLMAEERLGAVPDAKSFMLAVPQGVREMVAGLLGRVSKPCAELLEVASVVGREFDAALLERLTSMSADQVLNGLHEATKGNIIAETRASPGRFSFSHRLFREAIYEELGPGVRVWLHREVAKALDNPAGAPPPRQLAALAHHYYQAEPTSAEALEYTVRAGDHANSCLAHEEAVRYYERALEILDAQGTDDVERCELLLCLGDARSKSADANGARTAFKSAADVARQLQAPDLLARAALGYGGRFPGLISGMVDRVLVSLLEEALSLLADDDGALRARLLARLSRALFYEPDQERRVKLSEEALAMARRVADIPAQVAALDGRYWALTGVDQMEERLAMATEMGKLAVTAGDLERALQGHQWRLMVLAEQGDMVAVDLEIEQYVKLARELRQPLYSWFSVQLRFMRALMSGRFEEAERLAHQAFAAGEPIATSVPVDELFAAQLLHLDVERGRREDVESLSSEASSSRRAARPFPFSALELCRLGHEGEARAQLAMAMQHEIGGRPRDAIWLATVVTLAEVSALLEERSAGERLYDILLPYAGHNVMVSSLMCKGSASHFLGLLARLIGRRREAAGHFEKALEMNAAMGACPLLARTQYEYSRMLADSQGVKARQSAKRLLAQAAATADDLGMARLSEDCAKVEERLSPFPSPQRPSAGEARPSVNRFKRVGEYWEVRFDGTEVRLRDTKGMHYIAELLRHAGREVHVADLVGSGEIRFGDAGELLDGKAKAQYRARLRDLEEDLANASQFNDTGRVAVLTGELDFLTHELAAAYGLSGRSRRGADTSERMRKAVSNRIRASMASLTQHHPRLGQHLSNSIRTGSFCAYVPEEPTAWDV